MLAIRTPADPLFDRVANVLARVFDAAPADVTPESVIRELPNADSSRILEAIVVLEDHFGVRLPDDQLFRLETAGDLVWMLDHAPVQEED